MAGSNNNIRNSARTHRHNVRVVGKGRKLVLPRLSGQQIQAAKRMRQLHMVACGLQYLHKCTQAA